MKLNFNKRFLDAKGNETQEVISEVLQQILYSAGANEKIALNPDEKYSAYKLMQRLAPDSEVELTIEEASFLKKLAGAVLMAGAYGQIHDLLEGINY
jgi:hypothetical protein